MELDYIQELFRKHLTLWVPLSAICSYLGSFHLGFAKKTQQFVPMFYCSQQAPSFQKSPAEWALFLWIDLK